MQAGIKEEISRAVTAFSKMDARNIAWIAPRGQVVLDCWKTPLGFLFRYYSHRGQKGPPQEGQTSYYSVFPNGKLSCSAIPVDGAGAEAPREKLGEIEIDFTTKPPSWRAVGEE